MPIETINIPPQDNTAGKFIKIDGKKIIKIIIDKDLAQFLNIKIPINSTTDAIKRTKIMIEKIITSVSKFSIFSNTSASIILSNFSVNSVVKTESYTPDKIHNTKLKITKILNCFFVIFSKKFSIFFIIFFMINKY
jgi:hypothetical protein